MLVDDDLENSPHSDGDAAHERRQLLLYGDGRYDVGVAGAVDTRRKWRHVGCRLGDDHRRRHRCGRRQRGRQDGLRAQLLKSNRQRAQIGERRLGGGGSYIGVAEQLEHLREDVRGRRVLFLIECRFGLRVPLLNDPREQATPGVAERGAHTGRHVGVRRSIRWGRHDERLDRLESFVAPTKRQKTKRPVLLDGRALLSWDTRRAQAVQDAQRLLVRGRRVQLTRRGQRILPYDTVGHREHEYDDETGDEHVRGAGAHFFLISTLSFARVVAVTVTKCRCSPRSGCRNTTS